MSVVDEYPAEVNCRGLAQLRERRGTVRSGVGASPMNADLHTRLPDASQWSGT